MAYYGPGTDDISFVPLTHDEEKQLFATFYHGANEAIRYAARDELIRRHLKFVARLSLVHAKNVLTEEDAISAGNDGLMMALHGGKFDPELGVRFATYLRQYVRGCVMKALREQGRHHNGMSDTERGADDAITTGAYAYDTQFISSPYRAACPANFLGSAASRVLEDRAFFDAGYEEQELNEVRREAVEKQLAKLPETEAAAIRGIFFEHKNHAEIGAERGMTRQASQQALVRGLKSLAVLLKHRRQELL